jgi:hypothetical protein
MENGKSMISFIEKFLDAFQRTGNTIEVFVNPSKKELASIPDNQAAHGYRFFIDADKKKIYFLAGEVIHYWALANSRELVRELKMGTSKWSSAWATGEHVDRIMMGYTDRKMQNIVMDILDEVPNGSKKYREQTIENLQAFLDKDISWVKKYGINPKDIEGPIKARISKLEKLVRRPGGAGE